MEYERYIVKRKSCEVYLRSPDCYGKIDTVEDILFAAQFESFDKALGHAKRYVDRHRRTTELADFEIVELWMKMDRIGTKNCLSDHYTFHTTNRNITQEQVNNTLWRLAYKYPITFEYQVLPTDRPEEYEVSIYDIKWE